MPDLSATSYILGEETPAAFLNWFSVLILFPQFLEGKGTLEAKLFNTGLAVLGNQQL